MAKGPDAFRTISEASEEVGVAPHVLRFWETRFSFVKPMTRAGGRRFYRPQDIAVLRSLRALLHDQGRSISAVQALHRKEGARGLHRAAAQAAVPDAAAHRLEPVFGSPVQSRLRAVLAELELMQARVNRTLAGA